MTLIQPPAQSNPMSHCHYHWCPMASKCHDHAGKGHLIGDNIFSEHAAQHGHRAPSVSRPRERSDDRSVRDGVPVAMQHILEQALCAFEVPHSGHVTHPAAWRKAGSDDDYVTWGYAFDVDTNV